MSPFMRGLKAAKAGLNIEDCRMTGQDKTEWELGFKSYVPEPETPIKMGWSDED